MLFIYTALCLAFLFLVVGSVTAQDETETTGEGVVDAVLERFRSTEFETNETKLCFLKRIAWVEYSILWLPFELLLLLYTLSDLRGVAGGDGELGCLCGKAGTSHLCDGSAHSSGCVVNGSNGSNAMAAV